MVILSIQLDNDFSLKESLVFLKRSDFEITHFVVEDAFYKAVKLNDSIYILKVVQYGKEIRIEIQNKDYLNSSEKSLITNYIVELFDIKADLTGFYEKLNENKLIHDRLIKYKGTRIVSIPDLFEAVIWAIIGQHINLQLAFKIKKVFVEKYGEKIVREDKIYYLFPEPGNLNRLLPEDFLKLKLTRRKSEYITGIIKHFNENKDFWNSLKDAELLCELIKIRGIGKWTANYILLRNRRYSEAYPVGDIGILHALRNIYELESKPGNDLADKIFNKFNGYKGLLTYYLWRSLYD